MIAALVVLALDSNDVSAIFRRCAAAHNGMKSAEVVAVQSANIGQKAMERFLLQYRRPKEAAILRVGLSKGVYVRLPNVEAYDLALGQAQRGKVRPKAGLGEALQKGDPGLDGLLLALADHGGMEGWLNPMRSQKGWSVVRRHPGRCVFHSEKGDIDLDFDSRGRLEAAHIHSRKADVRWTLEYRQLPANTTLSPRGLRMVSKFSIHRPPRYATDEARALMEAAFDAYENVRQIAFEVRQGSETRVVWLDGSRIRQRSSTKDWSYDGRYLLLLDRRTGSVVRSAVRPSRLVSLLSSRGEMIEPMLNRFRRQINPLRAIVDADMLVRKIGEALVNRVPCVLVTATAPGIRLTMAIRRKDYLLARLTSETLDRSGALVASSDRGYKITSYRHPISPRVFGAKP